MWGVAVVNSRSEWHSMFLPPHYLFVRLDLVEQLQLSKGDIAVGMVRATSGLNFLQQEGSARGREPKQHENIVVRSEYHPAFETDPAEEAASSFGPTTKKLKAEEAAFDRCGNEDEAMDAAAASGEAEARGAAEQINKQDQDKEQEYRSWRVRSHRGYKSEWRV